VAALQLAQAQHSTWRRAATTRTVRQRDAVSKILKLRSIGTSMIHPYTTQNGICKATRGLRV